MLINCFIKSQPRRRKAVALITTLLLITLLIAVTSQLVTATAVESVSAARRHRSLLHELAVRSALIVVTDRLSAQDGQDNPLIRELDQSGAAETLVSVGPLTVRCVLRDDASKFNPNLFPRADQQNILRRKLSLLRDQLSLPPVQPLIKPLSTKNASAAGAVFYGFDQLFTGIAPGAIIRWSNDSGADVSNVWSDMITFWGDGRVNLRRVNETVLEAVLEDVEAGLGRRILDARTTDRTMNFLQAGLIGVSAEIRERVASRLTIDSHRYSIMIETSLEADRRRWLVVAVIDQGEFQLLHRSQLTW